MASKKQKIAELGLTEQEIIESMDFENFMKELTQKSGLEDILKPFAEVFNNEDIKRSLAAIEKNQNRIQNMLVKIGNGLNQIDRKLKRNGFK